MPQTSSFVITNDAGAAVRARPGSCGRAQPRGRSQARWPGGHSRGGSARFVDGRSRKGAARHDGLAGAAARAQPGSRTGAGREGAARLDGLADLETP